MIARWLVSTLAADKQGQLVDLSKHRRVLNEKAFKQQNMQRKQMAKAILRTRDQAAIPVKFVCECAEAGCAEAIELTIHEFELIHRKNNAFIVKAGHQQTDIEKVSGKHKEYL